MAPSQVDLAGAVAKVRGEQAAAGTPNEKRETALSLTHDGITEWFLAGL